MQHILITELLNCSQSMHIIIDPIMPTNELSAFNLTFGDTECNKCQIK